MRAVMRCVFRFHSLSQRCWGVTRTLSLACEVVRLPLPSTLKMAMEMRWEDHSAVAETRKQCVITLGRAMSGFSILTLTTSRPVVAVGSLLGPWSSMDFARVRARSAYIDCGYDCKLVIS